MYSCIKPSLNSEENFRGTLQYITCFMCHLCFSQAFHLVGLIDIFRENQSNKTNRKEQKKSIEVPNIRA